VINSIAAFCSGTHTVWFTRSRELPPGIHARRRDGTHRSQDVQFALTLGLLKE
jgi:hypothetical protein